LKALILEARNTLRVHDVAEPIAAQGETAISVELAGIGGSEYMALSNPGIRPLPHAMGHGIVGRRSDGSRVVVYPLQGCGSCSYCENDKAQLCDEWTLIGVHSDGGFQEQLTVPGDAIVALPNALSRRQAAFVKPFANSVNVWEIASLREGQSIAVIGAGGLGLGIVACASASKFSNVSLADRSAHRRNAAQSLGASHVENDLTGTYDVVFETVGSESSREAAIALARKGGKCIFLGFASSIQPVNFIELIRHQKQFLGSFVYSREQFQKAIQLAHQCRDEWVKEVSFSEVKSHLRNFQKGNFDVVKLALNPTR
jgi:threonine dehydrogenase-like Zn-dependent dehydrogenase